MVAFTKSPKEVYCKRAKKYENEMVAYTKSPEEVYCKRNARDINFYFYFTTY